MMETPSLTLSFVLEETKDFAEGEMASRFITLSRSSWLIAGRARFEELACFEMIDDDIYIENPRYEIGLFEIIDDNIFIETLGTYEIYLDTEFPWILKP